MEAVEPAAAARGGGASSSSGLGLGIGVVGGDPIAMDEREDGDNEDDGEDGKRERLPRVQPFKVTLESLTQVPALTIPIRRLPATSPFTGTADDGDGKRLIDDRGIALAFFFPKAVLQSTARRFGQRKMGGGGSVDNFWRMLEAYCGIIFVTGNAQPSGRSIQAFPHCVATVSLVFGKVNKRSLNRRDFGIDDAGEIEYKEALFKSRKVVGYMFVASIRDTEAKAQAGPGGDGKIQDSKDVAEFKRKRRLERDPALIVEDRHKRAREAATDQYVMRAPPRGKQSSAAADTSWFGTMTAESYAEECYKYYATPWDGMDSHNSMIDVTDRTSPYHPGNVFSIANACKLAARYGADRGWTDHDVWIPGCPTVVVDNVRHSKRFEFPLDGHYTYRLNASEMRPMHIGSYLLPDTSEPAFEDDNPAVQEYFARYRPTDDEKPTDTDIEAADMRARIAAVGDLSSSSAGGVMPSMTLKDFRRRAQAQMKAAANTKCAAAEDPTLTPGQQRQALWAARAKAEQETRHRLWEELWGVTSEMSGLSIPQRAIFTWAHNYLAEHGSFVLPGKRQFKNLTTFGELVATRLLAYEVLWRSYLTHKHQLLLDFALWTVAMDVAMHIHVLLIGLTAVGKSKLEKDLVDRAIPHSVRNCTSQSDKADFDNDYNPDWEFKKWEEFPPSILGISTRAGGIQSGQTATAASSAQTDVSARLREFMTTPEMNHSRSTPDPIQKGVWKNKNIHVSGRWASVGCCNCTREDVPDNMASRVILQLISLYGRSELTFLEMTSKKLSTANEELLRKDTEKYRVTQFLMNILFELQSNFMVPRTEESVAIDFLNRVLTVAESRGATGTSLPRSVERVRIVAVGAANWDGLERFVHGPDRLMDEKHWDWRRFIDNIGPFLAVTVEHVAFALTLMDAQFGDPAMSATITAMNSAINRTELDRVLSFASNDTDGDDTSSNVAAGGVETKSGIALISREEADSTFGAESEIQESPTCKARGCKRPYDCNSATHRNACHLCGMVGKGKCKCDPQQRRLALRRNTRASAPSGSIVDSDMADGRARKGGRDKPTRITLDVLSDPRLTNKFTTSVAWIDDASTSSKGRYSNTRADRIAQLARLLEPARPVPIQGIVRSLQELTEHQIPVPPLDELAVPVVTASAPVSSSSSSSSSSALAGLTWSSYTGFSCTVTDSKRAGSTTITSSSRSGSSGTSAATDAPVRPTAIPILRWVHDPVAQTILQISTAFLDQHQGEDTSPLRDALQEVFDSVGMPDITLVLGETYVNEPWRLRTMTRSDSSSRAHVRSTYLISNPTWTPAAISNMLGTTLGAADTSATDTDDKESKDIDRGATADHDIWMEKALSKVQFVIAKSSDDLEDYTRARQLAASRTIWTQLQRTVRIGSAVTLQTALGFRKRDHEYLNLPTMVMTYPDSIILAKQRARQAALAAKAGRAIGAGQTMTVDRITDMLREIQGFPEPMKLRPVDPRRPAPGPLVPLLEQLQTRREPSYVPVAMRPVAHSAAGYSLGGGGRDDTIEEKPSAPLDLTLLDQAVRKHKHKHKEQHKHKGKGKDKDKDKHRSRRSRASVTEDTVAVAIEATETKRSGDDHVEAEGQEEKEKAATAAAVATAMPPPQRKRKRRSLVDEPMVDEGATEAQASEDGVDNAKHLRV